MLGIFKKDHISTLKAEMARQYRAYRAEMPDYDCGTSLTQYMRPELAVMAQSINKIAAELQQLDPTFPKGWVPL